MTIRRFKKEVEYFTSVMVYHCTSEVINQDDAALAKQEALLNKIINVNSSMRIKCNAYPKNNTKKYFKELHTEFQGALNALAKELVEIA